MPLKTWIAAASLTLAAAAAFAQSDVPHREKPAFPRIELPERARGERAVQLLGARLAEVAAYYGMTPGEFARSCVRTAARSSIARPLPVRGRARHAAREPRRRHARFADTERRPRAARPDLPAAQPAGRQAHDLSRLQRRDAQQHRLERPRQPTIFAEPFDIDGVPDTFCTTELQRIQYIWQRVAEDYAPFDVDVTTEAPPADRLTRSGTSDEIYGTTVLITRRTFYNCSCGGVAYVGIFDNVGDTYKPALVFYDMLGSGNEKYVAEAISHEAGHNMGLSHDGRRAPATTRATAAA